MITVESSTISKSATSKTDGGKALLLSGRQHKMDIVFPIFDQYITNAKLPSFLFDIVKVYIIIQALLTTIWPMSEAMWGEGLAQNEVYKYIKIVFFFIDYSNYREYIEFCTYACLAVTLLIGGFTGFMIWYYKNKRSFVKWSLYAAKVMADILVPCLLIATSVYVGTTFLDLYYTGRAISWVYFIIGVVSLILCLSLFAVSISFSSHSVIIPTGLFPSFDSTPFFNLMVSNSVMTVFSFLLSIFPKWMEPVIPVAHIIWLSLAIVPGTTLPYHSLLDNAVMFSIYIASLASDLTSIILTFVSFKFMWTPVLVNFGTFLISLVISYFVMKRIRKNIKKELNKAEYINNDEATEYFSSLGLDNSQTKILRYLFTGVGLSTEAISSMELPKYIYKIYTSNKVLFSTLQILTFFPSETRSLNALFKAISFRRDLKFSERFIIYQIYRVKSLRATSTSDTTNSLIVELKELNAQVEANLRNFWTLEDTNYTYAEEISKEIASAEIQWKEAVDAYPNNEKISQEYSRFLTECKCDFDDAIYQKQITELIENGHNFAVDNSFRSFVRTFPKYLLNDILDLHGKKVKAKKDGKGSQSSSLKSHSSGGLSSGGFSSSTSFTIDAELEDAIGKKLLRNSRMRLALHHSVDDKQDPLNKWMHVSAIVMIIVCIATYIALFVFMDDQFTVRSEAVVCMNQITLARLNGYLMFNTIFLNYAVKKGRIGDPYELIGNVTEVDKDFHFYWRLDGDMGYQTMFYAQHVKDAMSRLFRELAKLSSVGVDAYTLSGAILNEKTKIYYCREHELLTSAGSTVKNKVIFSLFQGSMTTARDIEGMFTTDSFCECASNFIDLPTDFGPVFELFDQKQINEGGNLIKILKILIIAVPVIICVFSFIPMFIISIIYMNKFNRVIKILENLDSEAKEDAKMPISLDAESSNQTATNAGNAKVSRACLLTLVLAILTIGQDLIAYFFIKYLMDSNEEIIDLGTWFTKASDRLCAAAETFSDAIMITVMNDTTVKYTTRNDNIKWALMDSETMNKANNCLLRGCKGVKTSFGYSEEMDKIHFQERCEVGNGVGTLHDIYGCASINQQVSVFMDLLNEITYNPNSTLGGLFTETTMNIYHLCGNHLIDACSDVVEVLKNRIRGMHNVVYSSSIIYLVLGILVSIVEFIVMQYYVHVISNAYNVLMILIKHISPTQLLQSKELMDFILNRKSKEDDKAMGTAQSIIHSTGDAIICTGLNGIVEIVNPAVTNLLGYTPDQILGQHIKNFLSEPSQELITKQMELMQNGQSALTYEDHITCVSDSAVEINFYVTIIAMKSEGSNNVASFVFLLSDETELLKQQNEAENAKAKSEKLLYQILPKDIVVRLNRGEKDITFTVPSATIIFIDIVKFSEYSASLTPQEIMGNLSIVFASFDSIIAKYPVLTKIKLIGDVYMAAAGLFLTGDANPQEHAEPTVKFGIDCVNELEDINMKLNASLEVRVGVNTGGPLIAGVLGTDKPTFDIIGDPINISSRLQSTDIPGKIQISKATYEIISSLGFNVEERGEVFLKGKGKQMTYIVHPHVVFMGQSGSILSSTDINTASKLSVNV